MKSYTFESLILESVKIESVGVDVHDDDVSTKVVGKINKNIKRYFLRQSEILITN